MVAKMSAEIRKAVETLGVLSGSKKAKARYELRLKARRDHKAEMDWVYDDGLEKGRAEGLESGLEKGRAEGLERGRVEGREALLETARNALAERLPLQTVQKITGLDMETIKSLHDENR
jgi:predicted transposase/invertase (TIGR01784 family)